MNEHLTILGTCQICEREIAVEEGSIVHHGYRRPGVGYIIGDCFGVGYEPYEVGTTACAAWRELQRTQLVHARERLARFMSKTITHFSVMNYGGERTQYAVGVTEYWRWEQALASERIQCEVRVAGVEREIERMERLIREFEPRALGSESRAGEKARKERETRDAERAAKRAERAAKAAKLAARKQASAQKLEELTTQYRGLLEDLAANAEARGTLGDAQTRTAARELIERMEKSMRKTPKVSCYTSDLGWDALLVRLGVAQLRDGVVRHDFWRLG